MKQLEKLAKNHKQWVSIAKSFGAGELSEDVVQDMYLKVYNNKHTKDISSAYIWLTLRSVYIDKVRIDNRMQKVNLEDVKGLVSEQIDELEFQSFTKINTKIEAVKYKTHYSDVIILNNYFEKGLSMRKIAAKYNIAPSTVFRSIKKTKEKIRLEIGEDFEDYLNKEFELI
ncbi:sigma70-ECF, RNA polymerase sigma factor, sigma-70 family [uncultured Caudovirales phage]|uniref:Sigma70-ECF, RNA polymerase sigma factor, sigma-70 family n=1 Tax=uncultured Caudovirales phage TaxID=2100421 RepID=A0A6J5N3Q8_9CAUD|nr:sigma70-ECF, RNA polymerase sigma factor, sigma-70 family [uncultured Caudovirales phage]